VDLCFDEHPLQVEVRDGKPFVKDPVRKKWVMMSGEEYVRQQLIQHLIQCKRIAPGRIGVEKGIVYNDMPRRFDLVIFDKLGRASLLCECKSPTVTLDQTTLSQVSRYNKSIQAPFLLITNGLKWFFFERSAVGVYEHNPLGWSDIIV